MMVEESKLMRVWKEALALLATASEVQRVDLNTWLRAATVGARLTCHAHVFDLDVRTATVDQHLQFLAQHKIPVSKALRNKLSKARLDDAKGPLDICRQLAQRDTLHVRNVYIKQSESVCWATETGVAEWTDDGADWSMAAPKQGERKALMLRHLVAAATALSGTDAKILTSPTRWPVWYRSRTSAGEEWACTMAAPAATASAAVRGSSAFRLLEKRGMLVDTTVTTVAVDMLPWAVYLLVMREVCAPELYRTQAYVGLAQGGIAARWTTQGHSHRRGIDAVLEAKKENLVHVTRDVQLVDCALAAAILSSSSSSSSSPLEAHLFFVGAFQTPEAMRAEEEYWRTSPEVSLRDARFGLNVV
jgi:hypothetical protein